MCLSKLDGAVCVCVCALRLHVYVCVWVHTHVHVFLCACVCVCVLHLCAYMAGVTVSLCFSVCVDVTPTLTSQVTLWALQGVHMSPGMFSQQSIIRETLVTV